LKFAKLLPLVLLPAAALANPVNYAIDTMHSFPHFAVTHLGMTQVYGRFDTMRGRITLDQAAKTGSLEVRIPTASVSTGFKGRDDMLKGPDWFNSGEFPEMVYRSSRFNFAGDKVESIDGNLTLGAVTRPVKLTLTHFNCGAHPFNRKPMCGAIAETSIKRSEFGVKVAPGAVADDVKITLSVEALAE
jgi:polyisoprenoid-binding protein YceI